MLLQQYRKLLNSCYQMTVIPLLCGHCDVQLTKDKIHSLPNLQRNLPRKNIVTICHKYTQNDSKQIKRSTIHKMLNFITVYENLYYHWLTMYLHFKWTL